MTTSDDSMLTISFTSEEAILTYIYMVTGVGPSIGKTRDWIQAIMINAIVKIVIVNFMGRGFYRIGIEQSHSTKTLLDAPPSNLKDAIAIFYPWYLYLIHYMLYIMGIKWYPLQLFLLMYDVNICLYYQQLHQRL